MLVPLRPDPHTNTARREPASAVGAGCAGGVSGADAASDVACSDMLASLMHVSDPPAPPRRRAGSEGIPAPDPAPDASPDASPDADAVRLARQRDNLRKRNRKLTARLAQLEQALDDAEPALGYLFVITYGRSGSTLLMGVLNSIPGYLIRGENRDVLRHLFAFHSAAATERARFGPGRAALEPVHPFFGMDGFDPDLSLRQVRRLALSTILRPEPDTRVTGFKEIRWFGPDLIDYVEFLRDTFPGARFVINTRDHDDVAKSKWWAERDDAHDELARIEEGFDRLEENLGDACLRMHYDDYVADHGQFERMFAWLGEPLDRARLDEVLAVRHST